MFACLAPACAEPRPSCPADERIAAPSGPLAVEPLTPAHPEGLRDVFERRVDVFGLEVLATRGVSEPKQLHAAHVLAEYLDNDEDGAVDDARVGDELATTRATLVLFCTEAEAEWGFDRLFEGLGDRPLQDLYATEIHPGSLVAGRFDATLEVTLHLVTHPGYAEGYPDEWGESPGSQLADAMDRSRGRQFFESPDRVPAGAWYHRDDPTCDYGCMVTEYAYWSLTTVLGLQSADPAHCGEIAGEWEACSARALEGLDPVVVELLRAPDHALPTLRPDGQYRPFE